MDMTACNGNDDVICVLGLFCEQLPAVQMQGSLIDDKFASDPRSECSLYMYLHTSQIAKCSIFQNSCLSGIVLATILSPCYVVIVKRQNHRLKSCIIKDNYTLITN